jgi:hypothetical protein
LIKAIAVFILATILATYTTLVSATYVNAVTLTPDDNQAKQDITNSLSEAADHKYSRYDMINASLVGDNSTFVVYNKTGGIIIPPVVCGAGTHNENGVCVPDQPQCPAGQFYNKTSEECQDNPKPPVDNQTGNQTGGNENITKVNLAGDFECEKVIGAMDKKKANINVALGDLCYDSTLSNFKKAWEPLDNNKCIPGNHDQAEDGSAALAKESSAYCGDIWMMKVANDTTLLVAYNTNGNLATLLGTAQDALTNTQFMDGIKNVVLISHKGCEVHPNSHHGVEGSVKTFCQSFDAKVPAGVGIYHVSAHNHEMASTSDGHFFLAGSGGKTSHRGCGTGSGWNFCKETDGFLQLEINSNGKIKGTFYNTSGGAIS